MKKLAYGIVWAFAAMSAADAFAAGTVPAGYTEIEYIQGPGNARIVTDYTPQPNIDKIEAVVEWPANTLNANQAVWCSRGNGTQADSWTLFYLNDNTKFRFDYMPTVHPLSLVPDFTPATETKYTITAEDNTVTYSANGAVLQTQSTPAYSYTAGSVLALFASHYSGINANLGNYGKHKLYSFKVWRSGDLIHYFVPCKDSGGAATLVDICDNPATLTKSGTFTAGQAGHYYDDSAFGSLTILPIPIQINETFEPCRPEFVVSNRTSGATWTVGGDIASPIVDVAYANNYGAGEATVTVTGKGEYAGQRASGSFTITATKLEDDNLVTTDTLARRYEANGKYIYEFKSTASAHTATAKRGIILSDCLLVGGGGGGGFGRGGGGGGGGGVTNAVDIVGAYIDTDENFTVAVGAGGAGSVLTSSKGGNGGATSLEFGLFSATVAGGGGGGSWGSTAGADGGSGGGGAQAGAGGKGIDGIGHAGANGYGGNSAMSGGGGGAGHAGYAGYAVDANNRFAGNGGEGVTNDITGVDVVYGGGGGSGGAGAGTWWKCDAGLGGLGGGGNGGKDVVGENGVDGLGGGGGGGGTDGSGVNVTDKCGGNGGAGTAILVVRPLVYVIVPIPDQIHESFDPCRPEFVVSNRMSGATWTVGGDIISPYFDVEYANNVGIGTASVTITGKGEYAEANYTALYNILATKYEDDNISTTDLSSRRIIVDGKSVYVFTNAAAAQVVTAKRGINLTDFLVVGGGGGGGCTMAGGGGAGGVTNGTGVSCAYVGKGDTFTFTVGAGGAGSVSTSSRGGNGGSTTLEFGALSVKAYGGGGGGCRNNSTGTAGLSGGSGGGGAPNAAGGAGIDGQGFAGAAGGGNNSGKSGGGGGAGHAGYVNVDGHSGYGGEGVSNNITGAWVVYGGGGGGGGATAALYWKTDAGLGGIGGGGDGGKEDIGLNGVDGLGGGGGGGGAGGSGTGIVNKRGGNGGVGTVIFAVAGADFEVDPIPDQLLAAGVSEPIPVVRSGETLLVKDEDYTVAYADNDKGGVGTVTITGINGYVGKSVSVGFKITALYFAKPTVASEGDGKSWATAKSVANIFATLGTVDYPCEIWIAAGTVSAPSCTCTLTNCATLAIRGGFAGTETTLDERQPGALTVFDGANTVKCMLTATTYRDAELTLDQLKFYRAKENGFIQTGVGSLKIVDCVVEGNGKDADKIFGRGMNVSGGGAGTLVVSNCVFKGNQRRGGIYTYGGFGIYINTFANALVEDTLFVTNGYALGTVPGSGNCGADGGAGGAMRVIGTPITLRRCNFAGNVNPLWKNSDSGGTVMLSGASGGSVIDHCVFVGNTDRISQQASGDINTGGALAVKLSSATDKVKVTNCTFAYNIAHGHCSAGGISVVTGDVDVDNSVFWKNTRAQVTTVGYGSDVQVQSSGKLSIRNSLVTTLDGTGLVSVNPDNLVIDADSVIAADPKLVTTAAAFDSLLTKTASAIYYNPNKSGIYESLAAMDAHLKSPTGYFVNGGAAGPATTDYSPAIDLGDPAADYSNEPSPNGSRLNAGAYGNTAEASSTAIGQPEANVAVTFPDGMTRPKVTISMGLESGDGYIATVQIYCSTGGVLLANQIWKGVGNGEVLEFSLPYYLTNGDNFNVRVTINAPSATQVEYQKSETVEGSYPPFYGKGGGPNVIHVREGADCLMNGTSWTDAYPDLATAMASSPDASKTEMWLAVTNNYMEKQATLNSSLIIRGGFTGVENAADERAEGATTRLDGNNVYRTMNFSVAQGATLTVERVVFTHSANSELAKTGAGDLIVRDCWFTDSIQTGSLLGRGIYASGGTARIANCKFTNLIGPADTNNGGGDGICFSSCTAAYVDDCIFVTNGLSQFIRTKVWGARHRGAGVWVDATPAIFRNCRFSANIAAMHESSGYSGTLYFSGASGGSKLINCTVVGNSDSQGSQSSATIVDAGAIVCTMSATNQTLDVENCTVAYNITQGQKTAAGITVIKGTVNVKDSIVYGNVRGLTNIAQSAGADFEVKANGYLNLRYSLVTGMTSNYVHSVNDENLAIGPGVIYDVDPLLATTTNDFWKLFTADGAGVYIANGQRGKCAVLDVYPRTRTGYIKDGVLIRDPERVESPTIDAGDPASDYSKEPQLIGIGGNGGRVNLGFSGNTPEAALTRRTGSVYYIR